MAAITCEMCGSATVQIGDVQETHGDRLYTFEQFQCVSQCCQHVQRVPIPVHNAALLPKVVTQSMCGCAFDPMD